MQKKSDLTVVLLGLFIRGILANILQALAEMFPLTEENASL